ncbi:MAG: putative sliding-clamp-loader subunit [Prokaryotic dsDNA virus sp.]|nr:MAG: putative sliding-clamp-loader subunit [Prokaryotic dsDNA virus sp.]|tara:strand:+ start:268 stop:1179 length:912 start_codon:yes stop_codon:yes gene_type:complete
MLWTEKYRPKSIHQLIGQEGFKLDAEHWIENKDMPNVLLHGPAGVGKTAAAGILALEILKQEIDSNFFEINASDDRRLEVVRTTIKDVAQQQAIGNVPFKIIHLDELDGMTPDAQNALKRIMERYAHNVRFIITANDRSKIIYPLQSRCANYYFSILDNDTISTLLMTIIQNEELSQPSETDLATFISHYNGDVRRTITELQAAFASGISLRKQTDKSLERYDEILNLLVEEKYNQALIRLHDAIYSGKTVKDICYGLHEVIVKSDMTDNLKFKYLRAVGEAEWRGNSMTPRVLISWVVSQLR